MSFHRNTAYKLFFMNLCSILASQIEKGSTAPRHERQTRRGHEAPTLQGLPVMRVRYRHFNKCTKTELEMKKFLTISLAVLTIVSCASVNRSADTADNSQAKGTENIAAELVSLIDGYTEKINAVESVYDMFLISEKCYKEKMAFEKENAGKINTLLSSLTGDEQAAYNEAIKNAMIEFEAAVNRKAQELANEGKTGTAKEQGAVFLDITLEKALEKAKAENKYVLINFHTKTCGPCKKMEKTVFPTKKCGEYINSHFIPIVVDGEDNGAGTELAKKHQVFIYPTYMILRPDGFKEGEILGAEYDVDKFIGMLKTIVHEV